MIDLKTFCRIILTAIAIMFAFMWCLGIVYYRLIRALYYGINWVCSYMHLRNVARIHIPPNEILDPEFFDVVDHDFDSPNPNHDD